MIQTEQQELKEENLELTNTTSASTSTLVDKRMEKKKEKEKKKQENRFTKKKSKKKYIIIALALASAGIILYMNTVGAKVKAMPVLTQPLSKQELINSVSLTGTVESGETRQVYSKGSSLIESVNVQVGDKVESGTLLAQLDTADLKISIAQQQASIQALELQNQHKEKLNENELKLTEKKLETAKDDIQDGVDANLIRAENSVKSAQENLNDARRNYNDAKDNWTSDDMDLTKAEKDFDKAKANCGAKEIELENAKKQTESDEQKALVLKLENELSELEKVRDNADRAVQNIFGAKDTLSKERIDYRSARVAYENALAERNIAENQSRQSLDKLKDEINSTKLANQAPTSLESERIGMQKLQKELNDSTVTSPISGTVTAVYAEEGAPGTGLLFVIENTDDLVIKTSIKEYDIATVKEGMKATVKSDATGEQSFDGTIKSIDPTAIKEKDGKTKTSGSVEFSADLALNKGTPLRVGMNVRMNVIIEKKADTYAVPFEAVATNEKGQSIIYTTQTGEKGKLFAKSLPVTTGMETNFLLEVSGDGISDGISIISNAAGITDGMEVQTMPNMAGAAMGA